MLLTRACLNRILLIASLLTLLLLSGCGTQPIRRTQAYAVKAGDTVYSIAWKNGVDYHELARVNHINRDFHISIGQVLLLPRGAGTPTRPPANKQARVSRPTESSATVITSHIRWLWPVEGTNYSTTTRPNGGQGLVITGDAGQDVRATAAGRVVYAGTGLLGYGQLLIIKHDEVFLSAYGHTQYLYVSEGDVVSAGQKIASMGMGPNGTPQLYFEIRSNGSPVSPLSLLPQQR